MMFLIEDKYGWILGEALMVEEAMGLLRTVPKAHRIVREDGVLIATRGAAEPQRSARRHRGGVAA